MSAPDKAIRMFDQSEEVADLFRRIAELDSEAQKAMSSGARPVLSLGEAPLAALPEDAAHLRAMCARHFARRMSHLVEEAGKKGAQFAPWSSESDYAKRLENLKPVAEGGVEVSA